MDYKKSILLLGTPFFGYINRIAKGLLKTNQAEVDLKYTFTDTLNSRIIRNSISHINNKFYSDIKNNYYNKLFKELKADYNTIFILNGGTIPLSVLNELKFKFPSSEFILYIFDDQDIKKHQDSFLQSFDKVFTYSLVDSLKFGFKFRPFFYSERITEEKKYDISFIGTLHGNRYAAIKNFIERNDDLLFKNYLYSDFFTFFKNYFNNKDKVKDISFRKLNYNSYLNLLAFSRATIEIPIPEQKNITTRAIETLGTKTKLITRTDSVKDYSFYNEENILIFSDDYIPKLSGWLRIPYKQYDKEILNFYSLECWIEDIFNKS